MARSLIHTMAHSIKGLESIDGQLLDGLEFCARTYAVFDVIRRAPRGVEELRLLTTPRAKKMLEELLPLAAYVQARYGVGSRLLIRWPGGNRPYDASLSVSGLDVEYRGVPKRQFLEVTTACHRNDYLVREHLHKTGGAFAPRSTARVPKTRGTVSTPSVHSYRENEREFIAQVGEAIKAKASKSYPPSTVLLVRLVVHLPILDDEWSFIVNELRNLQISVPFREVVLLEPISERLTSLYRRARRTRSDRRLNATTKERAGDRRAVERRDADR